MLVHVTQMGKGFRNLLVASIIVVVESLLEILLQIRITLLVHLSNIINIGTRCRSRPKGEMVQHF